MSEIEKIRRYIDRTGAKRAGYDMDFKEAVEMARMAANAPIDTIVMAFNYGRAKGYRAANAEARREQAH